MGEFGCVDEPILLFSAVGEGVELTNQNVEAEANGRGGGESQGG